METSLHMIHHCLGKDSEHSFLLRKKVDLEKESMSFKSSLRMIGLMYGDKSIVYRTQQHKFEDLQREFSRVISIFSLYERLKEIFCGEQINECDISDIVEYLISSTPPGSDDTNDTAEVRKRCISEVCHSCKLYEEWRLSSKARMYL